ncbi:MAG: PAS domain-containing sensor histidine kinase, partial [Methanomassiliicoccales archaeon]
AIEALNSGASFYLQKGGDPNTQFAELANMIRNADSRYRSERELRRSAEALIYSERKFRRLFEAAQDGILILEYESGRVTDANPFILNITGLSLDETLGKGLWELGFIEDKVVAQKAFEELRTKGYVRYENIPLESHDGSTVHVEFVSNVYSIGEEKVIQCNIRDIEDRLLLTEKTDELASIVDSTGLAVIGKDLNGIVTTWNRGAEKIYGYTEEEMLGRSITVLAHPDSMEDIQKILAKVSCGESIAHERQKRVRKDGVEIDVMLAVAPILSRSGHIIGASTIAMDVTAQTKMEHKLNERMKELQTLYKLGDIAEIEGLGLRELYQEVANMLPIGWQYPEITCARIVVDGDDFCTSNFKKSPWMQSEPIWLDRKEVGRVEVGYLEKRPESNEGPFLEEERALLEAVSERIGQITERKRTEETPLRTSRKLNLLSSVTRHDLKNHLTILQGNLSLLMKGQPQLASDEHLRKALHATEQLSATIQFTKSYEDIGVKAPTWISLSNMTAKAFAVLDQKRVKLEKDTENVEIFADPMVEKALHNLIDNSIRHGEHVTNIMVSSRQVGDALLIVYEDDGVGINDENRKHLFEKGFGKNTGFGLFLSQEILAITGITITETGRAGEGVRFEMLVPSRSWRRPRQQTLEYIW